MVSVALTISSSTNDMPVMDLAASLAASAVDAQVMPGTLALIFCSAADEIEAKAIISMNVISVAKEIFLSGALCIQLSLLRVCTLDIIPPIL